MRAALALLFAAILAVGPIGCGGGSSFSGSPDPVDDDPAGGSGGGTGSESITGVSLTLGARSVVADPVNQVSVQATVTPAVANAVVTFRTTLGDFNGGDGVTKSATGATNADGVATVMLTPPKTTGRADITVSTNGFQKTDTVTFTAGPAAVVQVTAAPATVNPTGTTTIAAVVLDANNNAVSGEAVGFSMTANDSGGTLKSISATTNANGEASVTYTAGSGIGTDTVRARVPSGASGTADVAVNTTATVVGSMDLISGTSVLTAGSSEVSLIRARVLDTKGVAASGIAVTFSTTAGDFNGGDGSTISTIVLTDGAGYAEAFLSPSTNIATAHVIAAASGFQKSVDVTFVPGAPAEIILYVSPTTVSPEGNVAISAAVNDAYDNRISDVYLAIKLFDPADPDTVINSVAGNTDATGVFNTSLNVLTGRGTLTLRASASAVTADETIEVVSTAATVESVTLEVADSTVVADGSTRTAVRAKLIDTDNKSISGEAVSFSTSLGTLVDSDGNAATIATTDDNGLAVLFLQAPTKTGTALVGVSYAGFNPTAQVTFRAGPPTSVVLSPDMTVAPSTTASFIATVTDANDNAVTGETVVFTVIANGSGGMMGTDTAITNSSGVATATYDAGAIGSVDTIQASLSSNATITDTINVTVVAGGIAVNSLRLLASSPQLLTSASASVELTAVVKDANNIMLSGVTVNFSATAGDLTITQGITDDSGAARAVLRTTSDAALQTITVTATAGTLTESYEITTTGTQISTSGEKSVVLGSDLPVIFTLKDADGIGIANQALAVVSTAGSTLVPVGGSYQTNHNGQLTVTVTPAVAGLDTITASALGALGSHSLSVSASDFTMAAASEFEVDSCAPVTAIWLEAGVPQVSKVLTFSTTRGTLFTNNVCDVAGNNATTNGSGVATIYAKSANPGPVTLTASAAGGDPSVSRSAEFVASTPASIVVQATETTIGTLDNATLTAIVRDANNNLVKNADIRFRIIEDATGGSLAPASDTTDSLGRATTVYSSTEASSSKDGVVVEAYWVGNPAILGQKRLTVAEQALAISAGLATVVASETDTSYAYKGVVFVADAASNPAPDTTVTLSIVPQYYGKGFRAWSDDAKKWVAVYTADPCRNEDLLTGDSLKDLNGKLDDGEDFNGSGTIESGNVATVEKTVTTNDKGYAEFTMRYAKDYADWVYVDLLATASVGGSESVYKTSFSLVVAASDVGTEGKTPPGVVSPFGYAASCDLPY